MGPYVLDVVLYYEFHVFKLKERQTLLIGKLVIASIG
jgi:hypothetical protein